MTIPIVILIGLDGLLSPVMTAVAQSRGDIKMIFLMPMN